MFHFLARLGQKSWAPQATAVLVSSAPAIYLTVHIYGHRTIKNFLVADDGHGGRAEVSEALQSIVSSVMEDIKDVFDQDIVPSSVQQFGNFKRDSPPIKYFASSTPMPVTFGCTLSREGTLIGLPSFLNYDKVEDLPDNFFFIQKVKLFKGEQSKKDDQSVDDQLAADLSNNEQPKQIKTRLNRDDPEVQEYANSIILSEKAKKFIIARELFIADSWRLLTMGAITMISSCLSVALSRAGVKIFKLADAHVSQRLLVYLTSGFISSQNFYLLSDAGNRYFALEADKKAATLDENYMEGAKEYFEKTIKRNKVLRELIDEFKSLYDEKGNVKQPIIRCKHIPLDERLKLVSREKVSNNLPS